MEKDNEHKDSGRLKLEDLSTKQLRGLLLLDLVASDDEDTEADFALRVMEVISKREPHIPDGISAEKSWKHFRAQYLKNLKELGDAEPTPLTGTGRRPGRRQAARRAAGIAAIFAGVIILGSAGAYAAGVDIFQAIANWTQDTFYFAGTDGTDITIGSDVPPQLRGLASELKRYGVEERVIPGYLPEGYELEDENYYPISDYMSFNVSLYNDKKDDHIVLLYHLHLSNTELCNVEKDMLNPEIFRHNEVIYYAFTNTEDPVLTWVDGKMECTITGLPAEEMNKVIDSIK